MKSYLRILYLKMINIVNLLRMSQPVNVPDVQSRIHKQVCGKVV